MGEKGRQGVERGREWKEAGSGKRQGVETGRKLKEARSGNGKTDFERTTKITRKKR